MRQLGRLTAKFVATTQRSGNWCDGGGLNLVVSATAAKCWVFRYSRGKNPNGKPRQREMGLGSLHAVTLQEARKKAAEARSLLAEGKDPLEAKEAKERASVKAQARSISFSQAADAYIAAHRSGWRNAKHAEQWTNTLATYCGVFGSLPVADVDVALVVKALEPIWSEKPETARRVRARIENVLDWASVRGFRSGDNPARWRGHLSKLLPQRKAQARHHAALPYTQISEFVAKLREQKGTAARALEVVILTAARTSEVIKAKPEEFDLANALWIVPGERTKSGREHRVPIPERVVEIVRDQPKDVYVFTGLKKGKPLNGAMRALLIRMGRGHDVTVHGFRSTFRDWCAEETTFSREVAEQALAHVVGDATERAYRRGDALEKRRRLMEAWGAHCSQPAATGKVLPLHHGKKKASEVAA